jgi:hypothetical protein
MTISANHVISATVETSSPTTPSTTMTQNLQSGILDLSNCTQAVIGATWTGTPVGNFSIMGSKDGVNYTVPMLTGQAAGGAAGSFSFEYNGSLLACKILYVFGSSTGTWTVAEMVQKIPR